MLRNKNKEKTPRARALLYMRVPGFSVFSFFILNFFTLGCNGNGRWSEPKRIALALTALA